MITGISGLGFFVQKWPFRDTHLFFKKCLAETPIFMVFWGACFLGQVVKKGTLWTPTKRNIWLITEKLFFWYFCVFSVFFLFWGFVFFGVFVGGFKGQVRWPEGPPHLALHPPYLLFLFLGGVVFPFLSLLFNTKKTCFSPRKEHFLFIFESLPCFSLACLGLPLFQFLFLCLSLVLIYFSSFLSFFFAFF